MALGIPTTGGPGSSPLNATGSISGLRPDGSVEVPEGAILTKLNDAVNWGVNYGRKNSLWPMPFATACCGIELMAVGASRFDIARFGAEVMRFSPRQCDLMIIAGRIAMKMMPVLQRIWLQMPEPKWCISMGACASTGGIFDTYAVVQGVDRFMPIDIYIPGCPPRPEQILRALMDLQAKIQKGGTLAGINGLPELQEREKMILEKQMLPAGLALAEERGDEARFGYRLPGGTGLVGRDETK
jgi:NADH-quinone oxidoreductase subunit B